ncbi:MAG: hypothetical protein ACP5E3_18620 [Bacteroidales bacterium]
MNAIDNPYTPGAGVPPAVMAGRDDIINSANLADNRILKGNFAKMSTIIMIKRSWKDSFTQSNKQ